MSLTLTSTAYDSAAIDTAVTDLDTRLVTTANGLKIDGTAVTQPVSFAGAAAATLSNIAGSLTNAQFLASNTARKGALVFNDSNANLYLKFGVTASTTSFTVKLPKAAYFELPGPNIYTGEIDGIWDAASGFARVTELS